MNGFPHVSIIGGGPGSNVIVRAHDKAQDTTNYVDFEIDKESPSEFIATFKTENLKMIPDDYLVEIKLGGFTKFTNTKGTLKYFIALESNK
jgi:hypothetical protein